MQIFVSFKSIKSKVIDLADHTTCADAIPLIVQEINPLLGAHPIPAHADVFLTNAKGKVASETLLPNESSYTLLVSLPFVPVLDPEVMLLLSIRLRQQINSPKPGHLVFISTGSHINGDKGAPEASNQQCPADLVKHCHADGLPLSIILIDAGFQNDTGGGQIYDHDPNWKLSIELLNGRVRHFEHALTGFKLSTYQTHLENWGDNATHLSDIDLTVLGARLNGVDGQLLVRMFNGDITYNSRPEIRLGTR